MQLVFAPALIPAYTNRPMPAERHIPFLRDAPNFAAGEHLPWGKLPPVENFTPQNWQSCEAYLYAVDLFNQGFWWEAHELWKPVCSAVGRESACGVFIGGLIQIAAGELKHFMQEEKGFVTLIKRGLEGLTSISQPVFLGVDIAAFSSDIRACLAADQQVFPRIRLTF